MTTDWWLLIASGALSGVLTLAPFAIIWLFSRFFGGSDE